MLSQLPDPGELVPVQNPDEPSREDGRQVIELHHDAEVVVELGHDVDVLLQPRVVPAVILTAKVNMTRQVHGDW